MTATPAPSSRLTPATPAATSAPSAVQTQPPGPPQNLTVSAEVRQQLIAAYETGKGLPSNGVKRTRPDSVYYALDPVTGIHWAFANFDPSSTLTPQQEVSFQDGGSTGMFREPPNAGWQFLGSVGAPRSTSCGGPIPASVLRIWNYPFGGSCGSGDVGWKVDPSSAQGRSGGHNDYAERHYASVYFWVLGRGQITPLEAMRRIISASLAIPLSPIPLPFQCEESQLMDSVDSPETVSARRSWVRSSRGERKRWRRGQMLSSSIREGRPLEGSSHAAAGISAAAAVIAWTIVGFAVGFNSWWQTTLYAVSSSVTLVMVFAIQHTQSRQQSATQRKLDELLRAQAAADNSLIAVEEAPDEELEALAHLNLSDRHRANEIGNG
jgi:low affinity Fe/Cu permease